MLVTSDQLSFNTHQEVIFPYLEGVDVNSSLSIPIVENYRLGRRVINLEHVLSYMDNNGFQNPKDALGSILEDHDLSYDDIVLSIDEASLIEDSYIQELVKSSPVPVVASPTRVDDFTTNFLEACLEEALSSNDMIGNLDILWEVTREEKARRKQLKMEAIVGINGNKMIDRYKKVMEKIPRLNNSERATRGDDVISSTLDDMIYIRRYTDPNDPKKFKYGLKNHPINHDLEFDTSRRKTLNYPLTWFISNGKAAKDRYGKALSNPDFKPLLQRYLQLKKRIKSIKGHKYSDKMEFDLDITLDHIKRADPRKITVDEIKPMLDRIEKYIDEEEKKAQNPENKESSVDDDNQKENNTSQENASQEEEEKAKEELQSVQDKYKELEYKGMNAPRRWVAKLIAWFHKKAYEFNKKLKDDPEHAKWYQKILSYITKGIEWCTKRLHNLVSNVDNEIRWES